MRVQLAKETRQLPVGPSPVPHKQARTLRNDAEEEKGRDKWILALREPQVQLLTLPAPVSEVIMAFGNFPPGYH